MKFSLNGAQKYSNVDLESIPREEILSRVGAQLGAVENTTNWSDKYKGIVVAKVATCIKHPNADKLSLCMIDDGGVTADVERNNDGLIQVVCGADNVRPDIFVAWIPPGATVPSTYDSDPFVLEARELRGKISNGMIASPKELDISDEHEGILEINHTDIGRQPVIGEYFAPIYGMNDYVMDLENKMFTHRPDCFGNLGVARELAGIFDLEFKSPQWYLDKVEFKTANSINLNIENNIPELVPRFMVVALDNISKDMISPIWMKAYLKRVGIKPISPVVDITNYVMHLTGQPLHAFDYDKISKISNNPGIFPRPANKGEKLTILGGKQIILDEEDIVISTDKQAVALAGVMGGAETEVDNNTTKIILECANFDMYTIRRTSMRHGLFTEAVTRFNKGQSPIQNDRILSFTMKLLSEITGAVQSSNVYDIASFDTESDNLNKLTLSVEFINDRLGSSLTATDIKTILQNVEFKVSTQGESVDIVVPFWRMDISISEDIVEEIGRLYGYDKLPVTLPERSSKPSKKNHTIEFKNQLRKKLAKAGANEVLTYSFVHGKLLETSGIEADKWTYHIRNAISPDLQYYRPSLVPSLLAKIHSNIKLQAGSDSNIFAIFEIGKAHVKNHLEENSKLPVEMDRISFVIAADTKTSKNFGESSYYHAKKYVDLITNGQAKFIPLETTEYPITSPYEETRSATIVMGNDDTPVGVVGEFNHKVKNGLKLPEYCAGFEIDIEMLQNYVRPKRYQTLSLYPSVSQDVTYEVSEKINWVLVHDFIDAELSVAHAESKYIYNLEPLDIYQEKDSKKKRYSFRINISHPQKTMKNEEVNSLLETISESMGEKLQTTRI